jgi:hypothetical protein
MTDDLQGKRERERERERRERASLLQGEREILLLDAMDPARQL